MGGSKRTRHAFLRFSFTHHTVSVAAAAAATMATGRRVSRSTRDPAGEEWVGAGVAAEGERRGPVRVGAARPAVAMRGCIIEARLVIGALVPALLPLASEALCPGGGACCRREKKEMVFECENNKKNNLDHFNLPSFAAGRVWVGTFAAHDVCIEPRSDA